MNLKIKDIIKCTKGILLTGNEEVECENFTNDTRNIVEGDTFIALKGENYDGNLLWEDALNKGGSE